MKLSFKWTSNHAALQLRLLMADGDDVVIVDATGTKTKPPSQVAKGTVLQIADSSVAYGAQPNWSIRVYVDDVSNTKMTQLVVTAIYDDTVEPAKTENLVDSEDVPANKAADFTKTLTIPAKA